jgi:TnpA family transposase
MPVSFLSETERERFNSFPADLSTNDLFTFFTLSDTDLLQIPKTASAANRLGFALRLLLLSFPGFQMQELSELPPSVVNYVAEQINVHPEDIDSYGERDATQTAHRQAVENCLGFRHPTSDDFERFDNWLLERALEHDRPMGLWQLVCERFLAEKLVRPGLSQIERMVASARNAAEEEIFRRLESIIDDVLAEGLGALLQSAAFCASSLSSLPTIPSR